MGRPKALLPWLGGTLVEFQVEQVLAGGPDRVVLVLGHEAETIRKVVGRLPRTTLVVNREYAMGKTSSVRAGMGAVPPDADAILVLSVDQPRPAALIRRACVAHETTRALITVPAFGGRQGHPAIFARALFPEMRNIAEETAGLRAVRHRHRDRTHVLETTDCTPLIDINTQDDYDVAVAFFASLGEGQQELPGSPFSIMRRQRPAGEEG